jgi:hypothetical protein
MCGAQNGYPHAPECPYPYYGNDDAKQTHWQEQYKKSSPTALHIMINNLALWQSHCLQVHAKWSGSWKSDYKEAHDILATAGFTLNAKACELAIKSG